MNDTTKWEDRTNIREPLKALCDTLELDYERLVHIEVTPTDATATATILKNNENGLPYVDPDTNQAVIETRTFEIRT